MALSSGLSGGVARAGLVLALRDRPKWCPSRVSRVTRDRVDQGQWNVLSEQTVVYSIRIEVSFILQIFSS